MMLYLLLMILVFLGSLIQSCQLRRKPKISIFLKAFGLITKGFLLCFYYTICLICWSFIFCNPIIYENCLDSSPFPDYFVISIVLLIIATLFQCLACFFLLNYGGVK